MCLLALHLCACFCWAVLSHQCLARSLMHLPIFMMCLSMRSHHFGIKFTVGIPSNSSKAYASQALSGSCQSARWQQHFSRCPALGASPSHIILCRLGSCSEQKSMSLFSSRLPQLCIAACNLSLQNRSSEKHLSLIGQFVLHLHRWCGSFPYSCTFI